MRQTLVALIVATAACGGSQKSTTPPPPIPDTKPDADDKPTPPPEAKKEEPPPPPTKGPVDVTMSSPKVQVKLVSAGKGKKAPLKLSAKQGARQSIEIALDFAGKQDGPPEAGGSSEDVAPTLVLTGDAEVKNIDKDGNAEFELAVSHTDTRDVPGQHIKEEDKAKLLELLKDLKIGGTVAANGSASDLKLHLDNAEPIARQALALLSIELLPTWPVLPAEPIGVGAKWQVTSSNKISDKLEVTQTSDYELIEHKGTTWTIKAKTKISGTDQNIESAKATNIKGDGTVEVALADGVLYPKMKNQVSTGFTVTVTPDPSKPPIVVNYALKQATEVTPK